MPREGENRSQEKKHCAATSGSDPKPSREAQIGPEEKPVAPPDPEEPTALFGAGEASLAAFTTTWSSEIQTPVKHKQQAPETGLSLRIHFAPSRLALKKCPESCSALNRLLHLTTCCIPKIAHHRRFIRGPLPPKNYALQSDSKLESFFLLPNSSLSSYSKFPRDSFQLF